jgi:hypothetical protein
VPPTFTVYIDESGDEGLTFSNNCSHWFILSAVIARKAHDLSLVAMLDALRQRLNKPPKKPLHFRDLKHEQRLPVADKIAAADLKAVAVLVYKPFIKEPEVFRERYQLYYCTARYLLERVSWYCRDHRTGHDVGDGSAEVIFSNRGGMSYDDLRDYLGTLKSQTGFCDVRIDWNVIRPDQLTAYSPGKRAGLQIADAVAYSCYSAVQPSSYGFTEGRYLRMFKPIIYRYRANYQDYGIKFWPKEVAGWLAGQEMHRWLLEEFS